MKSDSRMGPGAEPDPPWNPPWQSPDLERLLRVIETATMVRRRPQFFLLAQGELQDLLPHGLLFCALRDARGGYRFDVFSGTPPRDGAYATCLRPDDGLLRRAMALWESRDRAPLALDSSAAGPAAQQLAEDAAALGLETMAAHGMPDASGETATFFAFCRLPGPIDARYRSALDALVPHLHRALIQMAPREIRVAPLEDGAAPSITGREIEILRWVRDGKSNFEIAAELRISPLTVKNHVQKILRKLSVQNRTQAVARAIGYRLIAASRDP
ncbi:MAG: XrtB/PEP-CTERM-associated transcriptional regulator EpsA [Pseudomonadota bacterium]